MDPPPERYEYDRMRLDGSIRDGTYSLGLWVWRARRRASRARSRR
jgi:hypothetical protein